MDKVVKIEHLPESLLNAGKDLISYYCYLTGSQFVLTSTEGWSETTINQYRDLDLLITPNNKFKKYRYDPPKESSFLNKVENTYELLESFINDKCDLSPDYIIPASILLNEFSREINRPINSNKEFPALMNKIMSQPEYSQIEKKTTSKGIGYTGIALKSQTLNEKRGKKRTISHPFTMNTMPNSLLSTSQPKVIPHFPESVNYNSSDPLVLVKIPNFL